MMTPAGRFALERFVYEHRHQIRLAILVANFAVLAAFIRLAWWALS